MKIKEERVVTKHTVDLKGKQGVDARRVTITLVGGYDVMLGDTFIYRDRDVNAERAAAGLDAVALNYATPEELKELMDMVIARCQSLKDSL